MLQGGAALAEYASRPTVVLRLRWAAYLLLALWIALSLWRGAWSFFPEAPVVPPVDVINPGDGRADTRRAVSVDIEALAAANLFGTPGAAVSAADLAIAAGRSPAMSEAEAAVALSGIEDGAPESRLPLVLRGVVAASEAGLGQAVIEHRNVQDLYQVGDELPVNGEVVLAKVLPHLVVLDNGGRYEVLRLFEPSAGLPEPVAAAVSAPTVPMDSEAAAEVVAAAPGAAALAARYREQLYADPESLADVVEIQPVREGDTLRGYRISPGRAAAEFAALGFRAGDVVTAINGLSLSDPANTMLLYQEMRSASGARFELERGGESVVLDVSLDGTGEGP